MKTNLVRRRLKSGKPTIGCFLALGSPNVAELLAHAGFDWLVIETEHTRLDTNDIKHTLMAISGTNAVPLVRVPTVDPVFIQQMLDLGAMGIVVPQVKTPAEAEQAVRATRYPPKGRRGFGPLRASHWTIDNQDYFDRINENILLALILETKEAVENLDAITSVAGVDALFFGGFDLCLSLGLDPMKQPYPEIEAIVERAIRLGRSKHVAIGDTAATPELLKRKQAQGMTFLGYAPDFMMLLNSARAGLAAFDRPVLEEKEARQASEKQVL